MLNIQDDGARAEILRRLRSLTPESPAGFGTLDAPRMLCHLMDQVRVALGDVPCRQRKSKLRFAPLRWIMLRLPIPKGRIGTVSEMLESQPGEWGSDVDALEELLTRLATAEKTEPHPVFGTLSPTAWGAVTWKHFDHHLRQFSA